MPTWKALLVANSRCIMNAENFNYRLHILILVKGGVVLSNYCFRIGHAILSDIVLDGDPCYRCIDSVYETEL